MIKKLALELAIVTACAVIPAVAAISGDNITSYLQRTVNPAVKIEMVKINERLKVKSPIGWERVSFTVKASTMQGGNKKEETVPGFIFTDGKMIASDMYSINEAMMLSEMLAKKVGSDAYKKEMLVGGSIDGKNKIVVFSDPNCPFCKEFVPEIILEANKRPKEMAVFLYHYPLEAMHPMSKVIIKAMLVAKSKGFNAILKVYAYDFTAKNEASTLAEFSKITGVAVTQKEISSKTISQEFADEKKRAEQLFITGTPAVYVNGSFDPGQRVFNKI